MWIKTLNGIEFIQVVQTIQGLYIPKQFKKQHDNTNIRQL